VPEPEAALGWPDYDDAGTDFVDEHFGPAYGVPQEDHFDETGFEQTGSLSGGPDVDVGSSHPLYEPPPEPEAAASGLDAHPQAGGRFEPNHGPPTEVYRPLDEPSVEADVKPVPAPHEVERTEPPASASAVGAHHPILDDLPFHQPATEAPVDQAPAEARISPSESSAAAAALTAEPEPESASPPETATAPAQPEGPPQLQFDRPPQRPTFTAEPPRMGDSDEARPKPPSRAKPRREDEMQGTLEFDVAGDLGEEGAEEDVLEVTPDFLQDTPEHDRLWFEQRPPKDFDFDG
jgi:hypothetical protein